MIEIFVEGKKFATFIQESEWTKRTMLVRRTDKYWVALVDTRNISAAEAQEAMENAKAGKPI